MKAFRLDSPSAPPTLVDAPAPLPGPGQAVVRVLASGMNPVDLKQAADASLPVPRVVGNEAVVEYDGRRFYAERTLSPHGSFAEFAVVDPARLVAVPDEVSDEAALAVGIVGLAAWMPLVHLARLQPGETVVVLGATGAVGQMAVRVARLLGAGRVVAVARDRTRLGALASTADTRVVLDPDDVSELVAATGGGADVVFDPVYGAPLVAALQATRLGARAVSVGASAAGSVDLPFAVVRGRSLLTYSNQLADPDLKAEASVALLEHARRGDLVLPTESFPLDAAAEVWELQKTSPGRKLVLVPLRSSD
ncbi:zinc-binding alcohol dehydrogenase family protein [Nocardioides sp. WS12]|uniref:quinone oxidoreductase family protein n=1 Tax=Nocardioides sp. WS12 TaxID=2486272 RepID=UPI0015FE4A2A|nr:zinc-binding alcohol dehydrogenase family protein [Nocardioides sp. WS12]